MANSITGKVYADSIKDFAIEGGNYGIRFKLIVQDVWKDKEGVKQEGKAVFTECVAYGKTADTIKKHAGGLVTCTFTLKDETYPDKNHATVTHYVTKFVIKFVNEVWSKEANGFIQVTNQASDKVEMPF